MGVCAYIVAPCRFLFTVLAVILLGALLVWVLLSSNLSSRHPASQIVKGRSNPIWLAPLLPFLSNKSTASSPCLMPLFPPVPHRRSRPISPQSEDLAAGSCPKMTVEMMGSRSRRAAELAPNPGDGGRPVTAGAVQARLPAGISAILQILGASYRLSCTCFGCGHSQLPALVTSGGVSGVVGFGHCFIVHSLLVQELRFGPCCSAVGLQIKHCSAVAARYFGKFHDLLVLEYVFPRIIAEQGRSVFGTLELYIGGVKRTCNKCSLCILGTRHVDGHSEDNASRPCGLIHRWQVRSRGESHCR